MEDICSFWDFANLKQAGVFWAHRAVPIQILKLLLLINISPYSAIE